MCQINRNVPATVIPSTCAALLCARLCIFTQMNSPVLTPPGECIAIPTERRGQARCLLGQWQVAEPGRNEGHSAPEICLERPSCPSDTEEEDRAGEEVTEGWREAIPSCLTLVKRKGLVA